MTSLLWLALTTFVVVQSNVILRDRHVESWDNQDRQMSRGIRSVQKKEFDDWLTEEQKEELKPYVKDAKVFREKVMKFYKQLPYLTQQKWDETYARQCLEWIDDVEAKADLGTQFRLDTEAASKKWDELAQKLPEDHREKVNVWKNDCKVLLTTTTRERHRRDLDNNFADFTKWMTDDQKKELENLKNSGKSLTDIRAKSIEFFEALPADRQASLREEYKGKCKSYFNTIATDAEMTEIKALYDSGSKGEIASKVAAIVDRQPDDIKTVATKMQSVCTDVYAAARKFRRDINQKIDKHLSWLSDEQKQAVREMYAAGKSKEEIKSTVLSWLSNLEGSAKTDAKEELRKECYKWLETAASQAERDELHKLHETDHGACKTKVREYIKRLGVQTRAEVEKNLPFCEKVWYGDHDAHAHHAHHHRKRRHVYAIDKFIKWLTLEQLAEVEELEYLGADFNVVLAKVHEFFMEQSDEKKQEIKTQFKEECVSWVKEVATPEELAQLKDYKEAKNFDQVSILLIKLESRLDERKKHTVEHVRDICLKLWEIPTNSKEWGISIRKRREHSHDDAFEKYLSWTSESQKVDLKQIKEGGDRQAFYKKVMELFGETTGETRTKAIEELKSACKHFAHDIFGDEKLAIITKMKESGSTHEEIGSKLTEFANALDDDVKQKQAIGLVEGCKRVYTAAATRRRREQHSLSDAFGKYLTWTTNEQKEALKALEADGNKAEIYKKVLEYFDATSGDTRKTAAEELKGACKHYGIDLFGEEKVASLKQLKESGASNEELKKKILTLVDEITDKVKKGKASKLVEGCEKVYAAASRKRRDHHEHKLDDAFTSYLSWTTEEQRAALKALEENKEELYKKMMDFYETTTGETRTEATEKLKSACKHFSIDLFGADKVATITQLKESGATPDELKAKVMELIGELTDEKKKEKANMLVKGCQKIYGVASRKRRDHEHTLEDALGKYLTWITDEQKIELKNLKDEGKKDEIYGKIMTYFEATAGETRKKAVEELKGACKHYAEDMFGEEKVGTLKTLKESGASVEDIHKKVLEFVGEVTDEVKKAKATKLAEGCGKVFSVAATSRKRRDHHHTTLEEALPKYLTWLTEDQKNELKALKEAGEKEGIYTKILEFFDATSGDTKKTAIEELKGACKSYAKDFFGEEKFKTMTTLKESGASVEEIRKKVNELVDEITDESKKARATKLTAACGKVYTASLASRRRRAHHYHHSFEDSLTKFLGWLTEDQRDELKSLRQAELNMEIYVKIVDYFRETTGETRREALVELKAGCNHYAQDLFGEAHYSDMEEMKRSGATPREFKMKINEIISGMGEGERQDKSFRLATVCAAVYTSEKRRQRRDHHHTSLEEALPKYLTWLTEDQKNELKTLKEAGKKEEVYTKILEFFDATSGDTKKTAIEELKGACKSYAKDLFGEAKFETIKTLKDSGASVEDMKKKVLELVSEITDEDKKAKATKLAEGCGKIYAAAAASRKRRDHHHTTLEDALTKYLTWLSEDQKNELKSLKEAGKTEEIYTKILEFFDATTGDTKSTAIEELKGACKSYAKDLFGDEKFETMKTLKESGASIEEIQKKVKELVDEITDEAKKTKAAKLTKGCGKIYAAATSRKRRDHHHTSLEEALSKYLTWLTEDQKNELKSLKEAGKTDEIYPKILEFFDATTGDTKNTAIEELKGACKSYAKDFFGDEKFETMKVLKETGASVEDMKKKVQELVGEITDEAKKAKATKLVEGCGKIYAAAAPSRMRRMREEYDLF